MTLDLTTNPLRAGLDCKRTIDPCVLTILGGQGDLSMRKLIPAIYHLYKANQLPRSFALVSYASRAWTDADFRKYVRDSIASSNPELPTHGPVWDGFSSTIRYVQRSEDLRVSSLHLKNRLKDIAAQIAAPENYLFYFSLPPAVYVPYADMLHDCGLFDETDGWKRLIVEKPFGTNLESAKQLNADLAQSLAEHQIYRIDHYVGKETIQNILVFRFANRFVEPLLNREHVDSIQITVAESLGVEKRAGFYDNTGALRDMVQNHVMQILSMVCMDQPASLSPEAVRDAKSKLFSEVKRLKPDEVAANSVRGQYSSGLFMDSYAPAYREEENVPPESFTETYAAMRVEIENDRWRGAPIYLRTGKRLTRRVSEVAIQLKPESQGLFGAQPDSLESDMICINIQPEEGIAIKFEAKQPGYGYSLQPVRMDFKYGESFEASIPEAYERLILDALQGDASLFSRADAAEATWEIVDPILNAWRENAAPLSFYAPGSWGPKESADMLARDGRKWRRP